MATPTHQGWRYIATRLNGDGTETLLDPDLPIENVSIEDVLSGDCSISGSIDTAYRRLKGIDGLPLLRAWHTAIYAESDGVIRAGAIVNEAEPDGGSLGLDCVGFTGYGRELPYTGAGWYGVKIDSLDVVRYIWQHIQSQRGGNIGLVLGNTKSNILIGEELQQAEYDGVAGTTTYESGPIKLNWYETRDLMSVVDDIASGKYLKTPLPLGTDGIFDYHERHAWTADGEIGHYLDFGVPSIGTKRNDLSFVFGVNIFEDPQVSLSGEIYASGALVLGAGEASAMIHSLYEPPRQAGDPLRRIAVVEDSTINTTSAATQRAAIETQWRKRIEDIDSITVIDHPNAPLGAAHVGDIITLQTRSQWVETTMTVRILSITYAPASGNVAQYKIARTDKLAS